MTLTTMAEALGLKDTAALRRHITAGKLRATLMGKTWIVSPDEFRRYKASRRGRGRPPAREAHAEPVAMVRDGGIQ